MKFSSPCMLGLLFAAHAAEARDAAISTTLSLRKGGPSTASRQGSAHRHLGSKGKNKSSSQDDVDDCAFTDLLSGAALARSVKGGKGNGSKSSKSKSSKSKSSSSAPPSSSVACDPGNCFSDWSLLQTAIEAAASAGEDVDVGLCNGQTLVVPATPGIITVEGPTTNASTNFSMVCCGAACTMDGQASVSVSRGNSFFNFRNPGIINMSNIRFTGVDSISGGTAIFSARSSIVNLNNISAEGITAGPNGSPASLFDFFASSVTLNGGNFVGNTSAAGVVKYDGGSVTVLGSSFVDNTSRQCAAINGNGDRSGGSLYVEEATFTGNSAVGLTSSGNQGVGGAMCIRSGNADIIDSTFEGNSSTEKAGVIRIGDGGRLLLLGNTFKQNGVTGENTSGDNLGGVVYATDTDVTVIDNIFDSNFQAGTSGGDEGGVMRFENTNVLFELNTFTGNTSGEDGGALSSNVGTATLVCNDFENNTAAGNNGGHIDFAYTTTTSLGNRYVGGIAADSGGALSLNTSPTLSAGDFFSGNSATEFGNDVYLFQDTTFALCDPLTTVALEQIENDFNFFLENTCAI